MFDALRVQLSEAGPGGAIDLDRFASGYVPEPQEPPVNIPVDPEAVDREGRLRFGPPRRDRLAQPAWVTFLHRERLAIPAPGELVDEAPPLDAFLLDGEHDGWVLVPDEPSLDNLPRGSVIQRFALGGRAMALVAAVICFGGTLPVTAHAAPGEATAETAPADDGPAPRQPAEDPAAIEAQDYYVEGKTQYATSNYAGAVEYFTKAFGRAAEIEDPILRGRVLNRLYFNLAQAHVRSYDVDRKPEHLAIAEDLLSKYLGDSNSTELDSRDAESLMNEITEKKANAQPGSSEGPAPAAAGSNADPLTRTLAYESARRTGRGLIIGGSVMTGVGGLTMLGGIGAAISPSYFVGWLPLIIGGGLVGGGVAMIVVGKRRQRAALEAFSKSMARVRVAPIASKRTWGGQLQLSF